MVKPWLFYWCCFGLLDVCCFIGPENRGAELGVERDDEYSAYDSDREDRGDSDLEEGNITQKTLENQKLNIKSKCWWYFIYLCLDYHITSIVYFDNKWVYDLLK